MRDLFLLLQIDPKVAFPRRAHPKVSQSEYPASALKNPKNEDMLLGTRCVVKKCKRSRKIMQMIQDNKKNKTLIGPLDFSFANLAPHSPLGCHPKFIETCPIPLGAATQTFW